MYTFATCADESFELYHVTLGKCLAANIDGKYGHIASLHVGVTAAVTLLRCAGTPQFQWMRHPTAPNLLLHVQSCKWIALAGQLSYLLIVFAEITALCLSTAAVESDAPVSLKICEVMDKKQWWSCGGNRNQNVALQNNQDLVLSYRDEEDVSHPAITAPHVNYGVRNLSMTRVLA